MKTSPFALKPLPFAVKRLPLGPKPSPFIVLALSAVCALAGASADASDVPAPSPQALVETRQQGFKKMGAALKALNEQLKTDSPDHARLAAAAQAINAGAEQQLHWFPAGSGPEAGLDTDALPHIWKDREKFDSLATRLVSESKTLATALAGTDIAAARAQTKVVADVCSTCHKSFRAD